MSDDTARFELPAIMKIEDNERFHQFLTTATDQNVTLVCSAVQRVSGLTAQTIAMACKSWAAAGKHINFSDPSAGFKDGMAMLGLSDLLAAEQVPA